MSTNTEKGNVQNAAPTYSIVIPHHNTPQLLQRLLNSIPQRDDTEVIVVDDNSDPSIVDFDHFPGYNRKGVRLFLTKEGYGPGYARRTGMDAARGKWLLFADADDYYTDELGPFLDEMKTVEGIDIVYFNAKTDPVDFNGADILRNAMKWYKEENAVMAEMRIRFYHYPPWNKMFNRAFVFENGIRFEDIRIGQDATFTIPAGYYAKKTLILDKEVYVYTRNNTGITRGKKSFEGVFGELQVEMHFMNLKRHFCIIGNSCIIDIFRFKRFWRILTNYGPFKAVKYYKEAVRIFKTRETFKYLQYDKSSKK